MPFEEKLKNIVGHELGELGGAIYYTYIICAASIYDRRSTKTWWCNVAFIDTSDGSLHNHLYLLMETGNDLGIGFCGIKELKEIF